MVAVFLFDVRESLILISLGADASG
jgi:hypothetical protein